MMKVPLVCIGCLFLTSAGCQRTQLSVSDTFAMPGASCMLDARLERFDGHGGMSGVAGVPVQFFVHNERIGEAVTDAMGVASLMGALPADATHYRAEVRVGDATNAMEGLVFPFPRGRTVIVCDIDETVSMTNYRDLVFDREDMGSAPFPNAAAVLTELSQHYGLVYLTARPGFLLEKSKRWLEVNGFPRAPVITTPGLAASLGPQQFKAERIAHLKSTLGTVGIGIGNAATDSEAYAMQHLLTLILNEQDDSRFRSHAVVLRDWKMIRSFFDANRDTLENPSLLHAAIAGEAFVLRPLLSYQRPR